MGAQGRALCRLLLLLLVPTLKAQQPDSSLRQYDLSEIVVQEGEVAAQRLATVQRVGLAQLAQLQPASAADVVRLIPGAHVQVNSRGEALVYLRGAAERQVALLLDGIPLNVPWDARFDLSLVPAGLLGEVEVVKGPFSVLHGSNSAGGVVNLRTKQTTTPGRLVEVEATAGWPERVGATAMLHGGTQAARLDAGAGVFSQRGDALPGGARLPFSQSDGALRTNTYRSQVGAVLRVGTRVSSATDLAVTAVLLDASKGIAPEGHLNPQEAAVRFWRYPHMRLGTVGLAVVHESARGVRVQANTWAAYFAQHIAQYEGAAYETVTDLQEDGDYTHGMRLAVGFSAGETALRSSAVFSSSLHRQRDGRPDAREALQRYRQHLGSFATEASRQVGRVTARFGAGYDVQALPLTGDKPAQPARGSWTAAAGVAMAATDQLSLRAGASRKLRFPTPREWFGTALNQFLLNPDLRPESILALEGGLGWVSTSARFEASLFAHRTDDAIDQRTVVVDGRRLRQRVNLAGSQVIGAEFSGAWRASGVLRLEGHLTLLRARGRVGGALVPLAEKPSVVALMLGEVRLGRLLRLSADVNRIAGAYALERDGVRPRLPGVWLFGARSAYVGSWGGRVLTAFARIDNAFDAVYAPQEGLPGAGRTLTLGGGLQF